MAHFKYLFKCKYLPIMNFFKNLSEQYRMLKHSLRACFFFLKKVTYESVTAIGGKSHALNKFVLLV